MVVDIKNVNVGLGVDLEVRAEKVAHLLVEDDVVEAAGEGVVAVVDHHLLDGVVRSRTLSL